MSARRISVLKKAAALVPVAALSVVWTISVAGAGGPSAVADPTSPSPSLQDTTLPGGQKLPAAIGAKTPATV